MHAKFFQYSLFFLILTLVSASHAEQVDSLAFGQYLDISQLESDKFILEVDGNSYDLYYGYHGSLDAMGSDFQEPTLSEIVVNEERKSLEITLKEVPERTDFWVRVPFEVITAEGENYQVIVDGIDTGYDLIKYPNDYVIGLMISEDTKHVEIIGTKVIPEFGSTSLFVFGIAIMGIAFLARKANFGTHLTGLIRP